MPLITDESGAVHWVEDADLEAFLSIAPAASAAVAAKGSALTQLAANTYIPRYCILMYIAGHIKIHAEYMHDKCKIHRIRILITMYPNSITNVPSPHTPRTLSTGGTSITMDGDVADTAHANTNPY